MNLVSCNLDSRVKYVRLDCLLGSVSNMYIKIFTIGLSGINLHNKLVLELHDYYHAIRKIVQKEFRCWQVSITTLVKKIQRGCVSKSMLPMLAKEIQHG